MNPSMLFIRKKDDYYGIVAEEFIRQHFKNPFIMRLTRGEQERSDESVYWTGDWIISYLSPWIIPEYVLKRAAKGAINFHPGPPEYPGIGCTNFAIYDQVNTFGVTCHHMNEKVDTGSIIRVKRFTLFDSDTVWSLTQRSYGYMLSMFYDIASLILAGEDLPVSDDFWRAIPFTREELNELCRVTHYMTPDVIKRRIKATEFPGAPGAYVEVGGVRFEAKGEE